MNVSEELAALFKVRPGTPIPASKPASSGADAFFEMMRKATPPPAPVPPRTETEAEKAAREKAIADGVAAYRAKKAEPFVVPEIRTAAPATAAIDIRAAASEALAKVGWFDSPEGAAGAPFEGPSIFSEVSRPVSGGLFKGVEKVGKKKDRKPLPKGRVSLATLFELPEEPSFTKASKVGKAQRREGVRDSHELKRILTIERRPPIIDTAEDLTDEFRKPGAPGKMRLWPVQSAALGEARRAGGLFGALGVGQGKTLTSLLMGSALNARMTVILVPPALRAQLINVDIPRLSKEWQIPLARIRVVAYSQISSATSADILEDIKPDLIVADEAHSLRYRTAARTKRFLRYMKDHPECRFVGLSGTMTRRSLKDYQHLAELALRKNSPLPNHFPTLGEWAEALDVSDDPMPPGALLQLCTDEELGDVAKLWENEDEHVMENVQHVVREAFRRRLVETPGVVATAESAIGTSLIINAVRPMVPAEIQQEIMNVRARWEIQGEELVDALAVARVARQLAAGFYYRWAWPDGVPDVEWLDARKEWNREVREILRLSRKGLDSPMLIAAAIERGEYESTTYARWRAVKDRPEPPREAVWIHDFLIKAAIAWAEKNASKAAPAIVWYLHTTVGERLAAATGWPFFGPGTKANEALTQVDAQATPVIICSAKAHGVGKNLQPFCQNLLTTPIPGGADMEQLIARTHRPGQLADEVTVDVFVHTTETEAAFRNSVRDACYIESTTGQRQKLNFAEKLGFGDKAFDFAGRESINIESEGIEWKSTRDLFKR